MLLLVILLFPTFVVGYAFGYSIPWLIVYGLIAFLGFSIFSSVLSILAPLLPFMKYIVSLFPLWVTLFIILKDNKGQIVDLFHKYGLLN